ncbi:hypothetical protein CJP72_01320 [Citrobacter sp. NCU1]|uniref:AGE family epimerase/isomerase n=1 Tax=Citrobacter sp. NCU1 TaxID=2026683 RepID=UPI001390929C|nr:AGE family epimerase/isomerase [Citrobacter sp. NCU1]NDO79455.1 hypothetical protein [Citrobacter sp. NCU1]
MLINTKEFVTWMHNTALPCFLSQGIKTREDGSICFAETLPERSPLIRSRVQTRQLYVFAHATRTGWCDASEILNNIMKEGLADFIDKDGAFLFSNAGDALALQTNTYEQAFALLAFSELYSLTNDRHILTHAEKLHDWMKIHLSLAEGGYALNTARPEKLSQNPHMHLFEAMLSWWAITGDSRWEHEAHYLFKLFRERFFHQEKQCLVEFFAPGWQPTLVESQYIDPGHHHEWTWLLHEYQKLSGIDTSHWRAALQRLAIDHGENPLTKAVMNEIHINKTPYRATSRLWCQTERLKADVVAYETTQDKSVLPTLDEHAARLMQQYVYGETATVYCDEISAKGERISQPAPASTLYHLYVSCRQVEKVIQSLS